MEVLSTSIIRIDGGTQPRLQIDMITVDEYAEAMQAGAKFPPVTVFFDGADYWLADGFHRYHAASRVNGKTLSCDVHNGTQRDAILYSVSANATHGKRRTNEDKRRAVVTLLNDTEWGKWSDSEIARRCAVSQNFASDMRRSLKSDLSERTYTTKHGTVATMHTANIGQRDQEGKTIVYEREEQGSGIVKCSRCNNLYDGSSIEFCPYCAYTLEQRIQYLEHEQDARKSIAVHFSSKTDDWSTPQALFDMLNDEFHFTLDVCASEQNHKCKKYYAEEDDGLTRAWRGVCWMNPPYGDVISVWVERAFQSALDGATVVCLVPARTDTRWWWDFCIHGEVRFLKGRLKFNDAGSAPFPSALVIFKSGLPKRDRRVVWWDKWGSNEQSV